MARRKVAKVPVVMQMEALECGAACLTMILAYYGRWVPLEQVRQDCGVSRDGSKAINIVKAARRYGLRASGKAFSMDAFIANATFPCIVFWNFNHFIVVDGVKGRHLVVNDPARGQINIPRDEFEEGFTGVTLLFEPTEAFEKGGNPPNSLKYARKRLEGLGGVVAFVMATAAITSVSSILFTSFGRVFLDRVLGGDESDWLVPLLALMTCVAIIDGIASVVGAVYLARIQGKIAVVSSSRFMRHLLHLPMEFYEQRMVGDLQQRQSTNESIAFALVVQLAPVLVNTCMLVIYLIVMLNYSLLLSLVGVSTVIANAIIARSISKKRVNIARAAAMANGKLYGTTVGGIEMMETIKAAGAEAGFFARWAGYQAAVNEADARSTRLQEYLGIVPQLVCELANIAVLVLGIWLIIGGRFTTGSLLAFTGFLAVFMDPVNQLIELGQTVQEMQTQMERVEDVMRYECDVPEEPAEVYSEGEGAGAFLGNKLRGRVDLKGVTFGYSPLDPPLIKDFDLHLEPGQWVALVGSSGCGKSTIAKLVCGLRKPWSGTVCFDDIPIDEVPPALLRSSLAVVDQDIVTFDGTISDNVKLWDRSIEDYEVILACRDAGIHDVITARSGGYYGQILPGGRNFSGGQLQRIEIARVLAQDPTIIILDEATSALDAQTEADVIRRIRERGITCIVVAHRLSTIRDCDEIVMLDEGKIEERGTHEELLAKDGVYARLVRSD